MANDLPPKERGLLKFTRSPFKMGSERGRGKYDYGFKIPRNYIENNIINPDTKYIIYCGNNNLITFKRSPAIVGIEKIDQREKIYDYGFKIPRNYIENNLIDPNKEYDVYFEKTK